MCAGCVIAYSARQTALAETAEQVRECTRPERMASSRSVQHCNAFDQDLPMRKAYTHLGAPSDAS